MPIIRRNTGQTFAPKPLPEDTFKVLRATTAPLKRVFGRMFHASKHPRDVPTEDLLAMVQAPMDDGDAMQKRYAERIRSPLTAIRAMCVDCAGGPKAVSACDQVNCTLWAFRMGNNPLHGKLKESRDEEIADVS